MPAVFFLESHRRGGEETIQTLLTIAGHDPSSGAGVTADLQVFAALGFFGTSAITALTVQSTLGVRGSHAIDAPILADALKFLVADLPPAGIKLGMLGSEENVRVVVDFLRENRASGRDAWVVLDPVPRSSSGAELLSAAGVRVLREELLPLVDWVTPNLAELAELAECRVETPEEMERAAVHLAGQYPGLNVAATGGHLQAADDLVVLAGGEMEWVRGEKIASRATHGTGCAYSSALLCGLVRGLGGMEAAWGAKAYLSEGDPARGSDGGRAWAYEPTVAARHQMTGQLGCGRAVGEG